MTSLAVWWMRSRWMLKRDWGRGLLVVLLAVLVGLPLLQVDAIGATGGRVAQPLSVVEALGVVPARDTEHRLEAIGGPAWDPALSGSRLESRPESAPVNRAANRPVSQMGN